MAHVANGTWRRPVAAVRGVCADSDLLFSLRPDRPRLWIIFRFRGNARLSAYYDVDGVQSRLGIRLWLGLAFGA